MLTSVGEFVQYFEGVRRRTRAAGRVTPALAGFRPCAGEWTCAEIVRHLAGAEAPQLYGYRMEDVVAKVGGSRS